MSRKMSIYLSILSMSIFLSLYILTTIGIIGFRPVGEEGSFGAPLVIPESYAFAIWGPIYLFLTIFPLYQLFKRNEKHPSWSQVRFWYSTNVIANGLWLVGASYDWLWFTLALIVFMLVSLIKINTLLLKIKSEEDEVSFWFERVGFSVYFGWITLATALNVSAALKFYNWDGLGISEVAWSIIVLTVAASIAAFTYWKYRDTSYALVIIWAFIALIIKHLDSSIKIVYLSILVVVVFTILILIGSSKKFKKVFANGI